MADDKTFKELLEEQRLTNKELKKVTKGLKDVENTTPVESLKDNLAEIGSNILLNKKQMDFFKKEGITKTDDEIKEHSKDNKKSLTRIAVLTDKLLKSSLMTKAADKAAALKKLVTDEETRKKATQGLAGFFKKGFDRITGVFKNLKGFFGRLLKKGIGPFSIGRLLGLAVIFSLIKFLNSPEWDKFKDEKFIPFITNVAKFLFDEKEGLFAKISRGLLGENGDGTGDKPGLLGHLMAIAGGLLGLNKDGVWAPIKKAIKAIYNTITGSESDPEKAGSYGDAAGSDKGWFGKLNTFNKALVLIGGALALKALLPSFIFKAGVGLVGVLILGEAISRLNNFFFDTAGDIDANLNRAKREEPSVQQFTAPYGIRHAFTTSARRGAPPAVKGFGTGATAPKFQMRFAPKGGITHKGRFYRGGQMIEKMPIAEATEKGSWIHRAAKIMPSWMGKTLTWLAKRIPLAVLGMAAWDAGQILTSDMPDTARPDRDSKAKSLMTLIGSLGGVTLGGLLGSFGGIPGFLAGSFLGELVGRKAGAFAYEATWLKSQGMSDQGVVDLLQRKAGMFTKGTLLTTDADKKTRVIPGSAGSIKDDIAATPAREVGNIFGVDKRGTYYDAYQMSDEQYFTDVLKIPEDQLRGGAFDANRNIIVNNNKQDTLVNQPSSNVSDTTPFTSSFDNFGGTP